MAKQQTDKSLDFIEKIKIGNETQYLIQRKDLEKYPKSSYSGEYKGIKWRMKRPYDTYWCGYVDCHLTREFTDEEIEQLDDIAHGGLTCGIGVDCSHFDDYYFNPLTGYEFDLPKNYNRGNRMKATFKTYEYVYNNICQLIDAIILFDNYDNPR